MSNDSDVSTVSSPSPADSAPRASSRRALFRQAGSVVTGMTVGAAVGAAGCGSTEPGAEAVPRPSRPDDGYDGACLQLSRSLDTIFGGAEELAARVKAMTGGNFDIRVYPAGGPSRPASDGRGADGTVQAGQTCSYYYIGKSPRWPSIRVLGLSSRQQIAWLEQAGGRELIDGLFADFGIKTPSRATPGCR